MRGSCILSQQPGTAGIGRMRGNDLKLHQRRLRLDIRKNFFTEKLVQPWNRLPRAGMEPPSLEGFKSRVDVALRDVVQRWAWQCWGNGWTRCP